MRRSLLTTWLALLPALTITGLLFGAALLYGFAQSLGYLTIIGETELSLDAYAAVLDPGQPDGREFWTAFGFSLWVSGAATLVSAGVALLLAVALHKPSPGLSQDASC